MSTFQVGTKVVVCNLKAEGAVKYNGYEAIITSPINVNGRYEVFIPDFSSKLSVLQANLFVKGDKTSDIKKECIERALSVISNFIIVHEPYRMVEFNVRSRVGTELKSILERERMPDKYVMIVQELLLEPWHMFVQEELEKMRYCRIPRYAYKLLL